jgi:hypothetical protein
MDIVIRGQLRGHNVTLFGSPAASGPRAWPPKGRSECLYTVDVKFPLIMEITHFRRISGSYCTFTLNHFAFATVPQNVPEIYNLVYLFIYSFIHLFIYFSIHLHISRLISRPHLSSPAS